MECSLQACRKEQLWEGDGTPITGKVSITNAKAVQNNSVLDISWNALDDKGKVKIWLSTTNNFSEGKKDTYKRIAKTKIKKETLPDADSLITERKNEIAARILDTELSADDNHFKDIEDALIEGGDLEETIAKIIKDAYGKR